MEKRKHKVTVDGNSTSYISSTLFKGAAHSSRSFLPRARGRINCIEKL
jgi:hypothetical protein